MPDFPDDHKLNDSFYGACYQSCYSHIRTVSSLTDLNIAIIPPIDKPFDIFLFSDPFYGEIQGDTSCEKLRKDARDFHEQLFEKAKNLGTIQKECSDYGLDSFVLPIRANGGKPLFYVVGGHFTSRKDENPGLYQWETGLTGEETHRILSRIPFISENKYFAVTKQLGELAEIYFSEVQKKETDERLSRVMSFISEISRQITGDIRLKDLLLSIVEKVSSTFDVDKCVISLLDDNRRFIEIFASNNHYADEIFGGRVVRGEGATGIVFETGETFYSYDAENDERIRLGNLSSWKIKSLLTIPLKVGGLVKGFMHLVSQNENRLFKQKEIEFIEALGAEVSLVVEIARLFNESQKRAEELYRSRDEIKSYFIKIGKGLSASLDLKHLLRLIVELSVQLTHSDAGSIYLIDNKKLSKYVAVTFESPGEKLKNATLSHNFTTYTTEHYLDERFSPGEIKSYLGIPLERKGEVKGLLNIVDRSQREFTLEEVELLSIFAGHAAMAIDNARLFVSEKMKAREATSLYQAAKAIGESVNLDEVLDHSVEQLTGVLGINRCMILLLDYKKLELFVASSKGFSEDQKDFYSYYRIPIDEITDDLWESLVQGKSVTLFGAPADCPTLERFFKVLPTNACLLAPLLSKEQLIGIIFLDDSRLAHSFAEPQIRMVMTLAIQIATAIQRATLVDQMERNLDQLKALHQVSTAVTGTLHLSKAFDLVVDKASHLIDAPAASMLSWNEDIREYQLVSSRGLSGELAEPELHRRISEKTVKRRRYLTYYISSEIESEDLYIYSHLKSASMGGYVSVPLIARKRVVGILNCFCREDDKFDSQEIRLLRSFANQAAIAIENARLYAIIQDKVQELATVFEVGKSITSTLDLDKVLDGITSSVMKAMEAHAASIMMLDEEHSLLQIIKTQGLSRYNEGETFNVASGIAGIAVKTSRPMVLIDEDNNMSPYKFPERVARDGLKTILSVPLKVRDKVIGLINIYKREVYNFSHFEINLLSTLANSAAVAIENARLYSEQHKIAQIIRRNLMPNREFTFGNIDVGSVYIPSQILSGDYFDVMKLSDHRFGMVIADVSGKGTEAAIYNARAKYILKSYAVADYSPADILTLLNSLMEEETAADKFISLLYVNLDLDAMEITLSSAGHEPLILWDDSEKNVRIIENSSLPIGVFPDTTYEEEVVSISTGDILVLFTDGIVEARSRDGDFFGIERLEGIIRENFHLSSQALANKIYTNVQKFTRRRITDDFSLLVVKV